PGICNSSMSTSTRSKVTIDSTAASSESDPAVYVPKPSDSQSRAAEARKLGLSSMIRMFVMALPHLPQEVAEVRASRFANGDDEQLRNFQLRGIRVEKDKHLTDEARRQRDVVVRADAEAQALLLPPREGMIGVVGQRAGELLVRRRQGNEGEAL